ncbi:hypothetical protein KCP73_22625 [Salmonella enterica subsp. enterica]|nr:hypothetical protein KCP73_22625 [Salmonella enterica subsp. enterica]
MVSSEAACYAGGLLQGIHADAAFPAQCATRSHIAFIACGLSARAAISATGGPGRSRNSRLIASSLASVKARRGPASAKTFRYCAQDNQMRDIQPASLSAWPARAKTQYTSSATTIALPRVSQRRAQILRVDISCRWGYWGYKRTPLLCRQGCRKSPVDQLPVFKRGNRPALYARRFGADAVCAQRSTDGRNGVFPRFATEGADRQLDR